VSKGARWHTVALGWSATVIVTMLIAAWAISIVGHQLSSTVTLPKSVTSDSSQQAAPSTPPRPRPSANHHPRPTQRAGAGVVAAAPIGSTSGDGVTSPPRTDAAAGEDNGSTVRPRASRPPASSPPPTSRPPATVTDQRAVETDGGTAAFTCTKADKMSLLYATSAPGYTTEPPRIRSESRIEVDFAGPVDQKIDARCDGGKVTFSVET
jgi:hypothetical protein